VIERFFDLANEPKELFKAFIERAYSDEARHTPFERATENAPLRRDGLIDRLVKEAESLSSGTLSRIQRPSG
jgi:hypothetical protein